MLPLRLAIRLWRSQHQFAGRNTQQPAEPHVKVKRQGKEIKKEDNQLHFWHCPALAINSFCKKVSRNVQLINLLSHSPFHPTAWYVFAHKRSLQLPCSTHSLNTISILISVRYIQSVLNGTHLVYPFGHHWQAISKVQPKFNFNNLTILY